MLVLNVNLTVAHNEQHLLGCCVYVYTFCDYKNKNKNREETNESNNSCES